MPALSQAQRRFIYAKFGKAFAKKHHFNNEGKLPPRVSTTKKRRTGMAAPGSDGEYKGK